MQVLTVLEYIAAKCLYFIKVTNISLVFPVNLKSEASRQDFFTMKTVAVAVYFWQYVDEKNKKNKTDVWVKKKLRYLQYETMGTTAEMSSRGQHWLICDMALFTSSAGCPHCALAHSKPWEGSGTRVTCLDFRPSAFGNILQTGKVLLTPSDLQEVSR